MKAFTWWVIGATLLVSCSDPKSSNQLPTDEPLAYTGEKAVEMRQETVAEIQSVRREIHRSLQAVSDLTDLPQFVTELESLRPRLEFVHLQHSLLPETERMVVRGNLAVATNQLEKELLALLSRDPGNDDLAENIHWIRTQLSPLPMKDMVRKF